ncbi:MAG: hypothetical protein KAG99_06255 [Bacteroidales bacterium]|nr:hypothetical protein [Bacteroidales bacterium]
MKKIAFINKLLLMALIAVFVAGGTGCASKKKLARQQEAERMAKINAAKAELLAIINDDGTMSLEEKERVLEKIKAQNIDDEEINSLIRQVELLLSAEKEELRRAKEEYQRAEEERLRKEKELLAHKMRFQVLENHFNAIVRADDVAAANVEIEEALGLFESNEAPVLIIINREADIVDYDRPTTVKKYLEFLKDQKKNLNAIENVKYNDNGKISELELIKK